MPVDRKCKGEGPRISSRQTCTYIQYNTVLSSVHGGGKTHGCDVASRG